MDDIYDYNDKKVNLFLQDDHEKLFEKLPGAEKNSAREKLFEEYVIKSIKNSDLDNLQKIINQLSKKGYRVDDVEGGKEEGGLTKLEKARIHEAAFAQLIIDGEETLKKVAPNNANNAKDVKKAKKDDEINKEKFEKASDLVSYVHRNNKLALGQNEQPFEKICKHVKDKHSKTIETLDKDLKGKITDEKIIEENIKENLEFNEAITKAMEDIKKDNALSRDTKVKEALMENKIINTAIKDNQYVLETIVSLHNQRDYEEHERSKFKKAFGRGKKNVGLHENIISKLPDQLQSKQNQLKSHRKLIAKAQEEMKEGFGDRQKLKKDFVVKDFCKLLRQHKSKDKGFNNYIKSLSEDKLKEVAESFIENEAELKKGNVGSKKKVVNNGIPDHFAFSDYSHFEVFRDVWAKREKYKEFSKKQAYASEIDHANKVNEKMVGKDKDAQDKYSLANNVVKEAHKNVLDKATKDRYNAIFNMQQMGAIFNADKTDIAEKLKKYEDISIGEDSSRFTEMKEGIKKIEDDLYKNLSDEDIKKTTGDAFEKYLNQVNVLENGDRGLVQRNEEEKKKLKELGDEKIAKVRFDALDTEHRNLIEKNMAEDVTFNKEDHARLQEILVEKEKASIQSIQYIKGQTNKKDVIIDGYDQKIAMGDGEGLNGLIIKKEQLEQLKQTKQLKQANSPIENEKFLKNIEDLDERIKENALNIEYKKKEIKKQEKDLFKTIASKEYDESDEEDKELLGKFKKYASYLNYQKKEESIEDLKTFVKEYNETITKNNEEIANLEAKIQNGPENAQYSSQEELENLNKKKVAFKDDFKKKLDEQKVKIGVEAFWSKDQVNELNTEIDKMKVLVDLELQQPQQAQDVIDVENYVNLNGIKKELYEKMDNALNWSFFANDSEKEAAFKKKLEEAEEIGKEIKKDYPNKYINNENAVKDTIPQLKKKYKKLNKMEASIKYQLAHSILEKRGLDKNGIHKILDTDIAAHHKSIGVDKFWSSSEKENLRYQREKELLFQEVDSYLGDIKSDTNRYDEYQEHLKDRKKLIDLNERLNTEGLTDDSKKKIEEEIAQINIKIQNNNFTEIYDKDGKKSGIHKVIHDKFKNSFDISKFDYLKEFVDKDYSDDDKKNTVLNNIKLLGEGLKKVEDGNSRGKNGLNERILLSTISDYVRAQGLDLDNPIAFKKRVKEISLDKNKLEKMISDGDPKNKSASKDELKFNYEESLEKHSQDERDKLIYMMGYKELDKGLRDGRNCILSKKEMDELTPVQKRILMSNAAKAIKNNPDAMNKTLDCMDDIDKGIRKNHDSKDLLKKAKEAENEYNKARDSGYGDLSPEAWVLIAILTGNLGLLFMADERINKFVGVFLDLGSEVGLVAKDVLSIAGEGGKEATKLGFKGTLGILKAIGWLGNKIKEKCNKPKEEKNDDDKKEKNNEEKISNQEDTQESLKDKLNEQNEKIKKEFNNLNNLSNASSQQQNSSANPSKEVLNSEELKAKQQAQKVISKNNLMFSSSENNSSINLPNKKPRGRDRIN